MLFWLHSLPSVFKNRLGAGKHTPLYYLLSPDFCFNHLPRSGSQVLLLPDAERVSGCCLWIPSVPTSSPHRELKARPSLCPWHRVPLPTGTGALQLRRDSPTAPGDELFRDDLVPSGELARAQPSQRGRQGQSHVGGTAPRQPAHRWELRALRSRQFPRLGFT